MNDRKHSSFLAAGAMRCCLEGIPSDADGKILAGLSDGEHLPCQHCSGSPDMRNGMVYREADNVWLAAWVFDNDLAIKQPLH